MAGRWKLSERQSRFAREVGSVVLGVLIALGLGAVATEIGWRVEVVSSRHAMENELGETIGQGQERVHLSPCVARRLDQLAAIVDATAGSGRLPALGEIGYPPIRTWTRGVWDSTISAQIAAHFDRDELDNLSGTYEFVTLLGRYNLREVEVWTRLYGIVGPGRAFSGDEAVALRQTIGEARMINEMMGGMSVRMKQVADAYGLAYDPDTVRQYSRAPNSYPVCEPIAAKAPESYGQAPFGGFIERALANPVKRTD